MREVARRKNLYGFEMTADSPDARRNDINKSSYQIKQLWQRTHEILRLSLLGYKSTQIAELLGIHKVTVAQTLNSDIAMRKMSAMRLARDQEAIDVASEVAKLYPKAIKVYEDIMENEQAGLSLKKEVADTILMDIGGHRAPAQIQGQIAHAHLVKSEIEGIKERGKKALRDAGKIVSESGEGEAISAHNARSPIDNARSPIDNNDCSDKEANEVTALVVVEESAKSSL